MRERVRSVRLAGSLMLFLLVSMSTARGDVLYSVTSLGPAAPSAAFLNGTSQLDPSGNYLNALSPANQAAFRAGSFDVFAHPGTSWSALAPSTDLIFYNSSLTRDSPPSLVTGNNEGRYAGTAALWNSSTGTTQNQALEYASYPHDGPAVALMNNPSAPRTWFQGSLASLFINVGPHGTVSGYNDSQSIIVNVARSGPNGQELWTPQVDANGYGGLAGVQDLGSLGGASGFASALNNSLQVVGWSLTASGARHAFLYTDGTMKDLNQLVPTTSDITLIDAVGIDAEGQIVAYGTDAAGQMGEYLLGPPATPAPEPGTLAIFAGLGIASFIKFQLGRGRRSR